MRSVRPSVIIHSFALLHAAVALLCRLTGVDDSLILTLITMLMIVLICLQKGLSLELTAVSVILGNVLGYALGTGGAWLLGMISGLPLLNHAVSTFLTTEMLGWIIVWLTTVFRADGQPASWAPRLKWLIAACIGILFFRFVYFEVMARVSPDADSIAASWGLLMSNATAIIFAIGMELIFVRLMRRRKGQGTMARNIAVFGIFSIALSALVSLMAAFRFPLSMGSAPGMKAFPSVFMVAFILILTLLCIMYFVDYAALAAKARDEARTKAIQSQFQYMKLKEQVNPHFLFNSLNVLDGLVCDGQPEQASIYIHKLSDIYRYMLGHEDEDLVRLRDEMVFVGKYADLLKVRFSGGIILRTEIPQEAEALHVVPCSVQLLVENAVKHNVLSVENPLPVSILVRDGWLTVENPLRPKHRHPLPGSGMGLTYISKVYEDLCGKKVEIDKGGTTFRVTLPLI